MIIESSAKSVLEYITLLTQPKRDNQEFDYQKSEIIQAQQLYDALIHEEKASGKRTKSPTASMILQNSMDLFNIIWYLNAQKEPKEEKQRYYRGDSDKTKMLAPGVYRNNCKEERFFLREMQVRCASQLTQNTLLDKLVYLQHYGCPTRLLDITTNPLVALYFACQDDNKTMDGVVSCFSVSSDDVLYPNSDRAQMLSHLSEFSNAEKDKIMVSAYRAFPKDKFNYTETLIEKLYYAIQRETPAFQRAMRPYDLLRPAFVQVPKNNPRIIKQDGAFILSGLNIDEVDCDNKIKKYVTQRIIIPARDKQKILGELKELGICQASLFPEVDKVAAFLKG